MDSDLTYDTLLNALTAVPEGVQRVGTLVFVEMLIVSCICALFTSFLYVYFYSARDNGSQIHKSFPLIAISVTALFLCIQFSLPLSLGLLGALSIVRFRTPIKEPEEIGFIMLVIATSISIATFNILFAVVIQAIATVLLFLARIFPSLLPKVDSGHLLILNGQQTEGGWSDSRDLLDELQIGYKLRCFDADDSGWTAQLSLKEQQRLDEFIEIARKRQLKVTYVG